MQHIHTDTVLNGVSLEKDVDGLNPVNVGRLAGLSNLDPTFVPCTPLGCLELLLRYGVDVEKKQAVVIGCSNVVGFPTAILLQVLHSGLPHFILSLSCGFLEVFKNSVK